MPAESPETAYDVFISYSHADAKWVWDWLVPHLKSEGLAICTDQESFDIGVPSLNNMANAVAASRHTLLVLTEAWVKSSWTRFEALLAQTKDPSGLLQHSIQFRGQPIETRETRLLIVDAKVLLAPIALLAITPMLKARFHQYLQLLDLKLGLIANFHAPSPEVITIER